MEAELLDIGGLDLAGDSGWVGTSVPAKEPWPSREMDAPAPTPAHRASRKPLSRRPSYFNGADPAREVDRRRRANGERRTFEVSKMWEVHHEICRRLLLGQKASRIAEDLKVTEAMVSYVRNSRVVMDRLEEMKGARDANTIDLAKAIREKAPTALKLLSRIIEGEIDAPITTRAREANNWLDRAGYAAVRTIQAQHVHAHFTAEEIEDIKRRAIENGFAKPSPLNSRLAEQASVASQLSSASEASSSG